ncbi:MAG: Mur ligase domain-containing protein [Nitrospirota bacterium]
MAKIFFSGVGGSGVSAIASFMADLGHIVVGSDRSFDRNPEHPICKILKAKGITIVPQDGSGIDSSFDFAVFSTAVEDDQPEVIKVRELGICNEDPSPASMRDSIKVQDSRCCRDKWEIVHIRHARIFNV